MSATPGPWEIHKHVSTSVFGPKGGCVASCGGHFDNRRDPDELLAEQEANARLIAAAPDLLAACKAALAYLDGDGTLEEMQRVDKQLTEAIAKAEGDA